MKRNAKMALAAKGFAGALSACAVLAGSSANAVTLTGHVIAAEYDHPAVGVGKCTSGCFTHASFTVGANIESTATVGNELIDFSDHALAISFLQHANFATDIFNGFVFTLSGGSFDPVGSVTGIDASRVSEPNGLLAVNLQGLTFEANDQIVITFGASVVSLPGATPLPGALPLFATGLGALAMLRWRRKKRTAARA